MVELRTIDADNFKECVDLKISDAQKNFVAPNVYSLAQAWLYRDTAYPFAIYADGVMVGFIMLGYYAKQNGYTLWRFMIDERFQRRGYGKEALRLGIDYLVQTFAVKEVYTGFVQGNTAAETLYTAVGFRRTGEMDGDVVGLRLDIPQG